MSEDQIVLFKKLLRDRFDATKEWYGAYNQKEEIKGWNDPEFSELVKEMENDLEIDRANEKAKQQNP